MNQVAVVIGGGQTLGAFLCRGLAEEGYRVYSAAKHLIPICISFDTDKK